jgi:hypothetical protein
LGPILIFGAAAFMLARPARRRSFARTAVRTTVRPRIPALRSGGVQIVRQGGTGRAGGGLMLATFQPAIRARQRPILVPFRPAVTRSGILCAEQLADLMAAQNGSLPWARYFQKWGPAL